MPSSSSWQQDLKCLPLPNSAIVPLHKYAAEQHVALHTSKNHMKHVLRDIKTLNKELPDGIFVRYAEDQPDYMKILIVGNKDTPYAFGLFEFDLFCSASYPETPPSVWFCTTGGNTVQFNPNIYACGKVCLSILGTWAESSWIPNEGTLLGVLVVLQSCVLTNEPVINEPGQETWKGTERSWDYNRRLHDKTVKYAMLDWIEKKRYGLVTATFNPWPAAKEEVRDDGVWDEVVRKHFLANEVGIMETVKGWIADRAPSRPKGEDPRVSTSTYSATYAPPSALSTPVNKMPKIHNFAFPKGSSKTNSSGVLIPSTGLKASMNDIMASPSQMSGLSSHQQQNFAGQVAGSTGTNPIGDFSAGPLGHQQPPHSGDSSKKVYGYMIPHSSTTATENLQEKPPAPPPSKPSSVPVPHLSPFATPFQSGAVGAIASASNHSSYHPNPAVPSTQTFVTAPSLTATAAPNQGDAFDEYTTQYHAHLANPTPASIGVFGHSANEISDGTSSEMGRSSSDDDQRESEASLFARTMSEPSTSSFASVASRVKGKELNEEDEAKLRTLAAGLRDAIVALSDVERLGQRPSTAWMDM